MAEEKENQSCNVAEVEVKTTELCFVTAVNHPTRTFFAQLCKFSNEELIEFNQTINDHCNKLIEQNHTKDDRQVHCGDIVCARYSEDNCWYRARILSRAKQDKKNFTVLYIDYGNIETLTKGEYAVVTESELPAMKRAPFGISCFMRDSENLTEQEASNLLECLSESYLLIKVIERQSKLQWKVRIPRHPYNTPFWSMYKPAVLDAQAT